VLWDWRGNIWTRYRQEIRLRLPPYVKLVLTNQFPRTHVTTRIGRTEAVYFGPFRNRSTQSLFDSEFLDLISAASLPGTIWRLPPSTPVVCTAKWAGVFRHANWPWRGGVSGQAERVAESSGPGEVAYGTRVSGEGAAQRGNGFRGRGHDAPANRAH